MAEIDKSANKILATRFPGVPNLGDITQLRLAEVPRVDVLVGGFPCQDVSVAGKRAGLAGARSGLFFVFTDVVQVLQPEWVVIENVPGLLSSNQRADFAAVLENLAEVGYVGSWRVLDSQYFGVAQRRRRVFLVGHLGGEPERAETVLFEPTGRSGHSKAGRTAGMCVTTTTPGCAARIVCVGGDYDNPSYRIDDKAFLAANPMSDRHNLVMPVAATLNSGGNTGGFRTEPGEHLLASTLRACSGLRGDGQDNLVPTYWDGGDVTDTLDVAGLVKQQMMPNKR